VKSSLIVVWTSVSGLSEARRISSYLLREKLAACVSITGSVESHYIWKGKKQRGPERLLMIKTRKALFSKLKKGLRKVHSYDCPEILALPVVAANPPYADWIHQSTSISK